MVHDFETHVIKVDIQTVGVEMNNYLKRKISMMTTKLQKLLPEADSIDLYLKHHNDGTSSFRNLTVRFGIPGEDVVASDTGLRWKIVLKNVEKKILRQLERRKLLSRNMNKVKFTASA